jgi:predicted PhzF superfamily epimerase YddE/YHI9
VLLRAAEDVAWRSGLAAFLRLPVTAFAWPAAGGFETRLHAPAAELEFSGPGLAALAHAIWRAEVVPPAQPVLALTAAGRLECWRSGDRVEVRREGRVLFSIARLRTVARGELAWPS